MASRAIAPPAPRERLRSLVGLAMLVVVVALVVAPPVASAAARSWSAPISLDKTGGQQALYGVACPSATQCTAVDSIGQQVTFNPTSPGTPIPTTISASSAQGSVACPSTSQCTAIEGTAEVTFNPTAPGIPASVTIDPTQAMTHIACPSTSQCTATDQNSRVVTFNPTSGAVTSGPTAIASSGADLIGVACPSLTLCVVANFSGSGNEISFNPASPSTAVTTTIESGGYMRTVACPSVNQCTTVDNNGDELTFDPGAPGTPTPKPIDPGTNGNPVVESLACGSSSQCTAVDTSGHQVTFNPTSGAVNGAGLTAIDSNGGGLNGVSCPTSSQCTAVDSTGNEVTFNPSTGAVTTGPAAIDTVNSLNALACPSASQCTAVDVAGQEVTFNPSTGAKISGPTVIDPGGYNVNGGLSGVACPSVSLCAAVANYGDIVMFDPTTGTVTHFVPAVIGPGQGLTGVACPSTTLCAAVDYAAGEVTFNPSTGTTSGFTVIDPDPFTDTLLGVACPSVSQCSTINANTGTETTFDPSTPGSAHPTVTIDAGAGFVTAIACPSTTQCTVADNAQTAEQVTFNPTLSSGAVTSGPTTIDPNGYASAVACPSVSDCVAVETAQAVEGDPASSASWTVEPIPGAGSLNAVACSSAVQCVTVDQLGNAFVGITAPVNASPPSISGSAVQRQTLTEAHGSWSPDATGYAYGWERCDSAGNACVAIPGAGAQSYTLTSADVGSTIRVVETASDRTGASVPASSAPTAVVTGVPVSTSPPTVAGSAVQGQTLTEAHGSWSNGPTGYAYQWLRCDRAGNACSAIPGASGQSYTLTASDVAHTIRAQEIASNAAGAGVPASSTQTAVVTAASSGGAGSSGTAPKVTGFRLTNNPFVVSGAQTPIFAHAAATRHKHGTTFRYALSEAATVRIAISRRLPGRRHGNRCVAPSRKLRHAKACTRIIRRGTLTRISRQGANSVAFSGRIGSGALRPGHYQARLTATDRAKRTSKPHTLYFTIVTH